MKFSEKLESLRVQKRLSQEEIAAAVGVTQSSVSRWLGGGGGPTLPQGLRLARFLGVPLDFLADDEMQKPPAGRSPEEELLLTNARILGIDEAIRRVLGVEVLAPFDRDRPPARSQNQPSTRQK